MAKVTATARMTVMVEIDVESHWGPGCTVEQVHEQAATDAENKIRKIQGMRIVGNPTLKMITHDAGA